MSMRRWDPLRDLLSLQERMNRLFEETLSAARPDDGLASGAWVPACDVYETPEAFVVQMDLPGVDPADVEVHVDGDNLVVRGERRRVEKQKPESFYRVERSHGPFARTFRLTAEVDPDRVGAQYKDGLLRIDLPKTRALKGRPERRDA
jgi:HSP20 family protein